MKDEITVRVHVTAADIKKGCVSSSENCPISIATTRAVKKIFGRSKLGAILKRTFYVTTEGVPTVYLTCDNALGSRSPDSDRIEQFIGAFDEIDGVHENLRQLRKRPSFHRDEIVEIEKELAAYERDILPFSFDLTIEFD